MIIKIFTNSPELNFRELYKKDKNEFIIGTDKAAYSLIINDIKVNLAIGDFDSCNDKELQIIKDKSDKVIFLKEDKDYTDTNSALLIAQDMDYNKIIIYANAHGRIDHFLSNISLLDDNIIIKDSYNELSLLKEGKYKILNNYKYISFFSIQDTFELELKGFKYNYKTDILKYNNNICTSNEGQGIVNFTKGKLLVIKSNDK